MENIAFYIPCHRTDKSSRYIFECVDCIRKCYGDNIKIVIINDNSPLPIPDLQCEIITSEYPGCGEMLGYYYAWKNRETKKIIVIHDSVFIQSKIEIEKELTFNSFFTSVHSFDEKPEIRSVIKTFKNPKKLLRRINHTKKWNVSCGMIGVASLAFLDLIEKKHKALTKIAQHVSERRQRMSCERILGILASLYGSNKLVFGHYKKLPYKNMCRQRFERYLSRRKRNDLLAIEKVWTGR